MRRYLILSAALLAAMAWGSTSFGRDKDSGDDSQSNASDASGNDSQASTQNRNDRQDREAADDSQHHAALGISMSDSDGHVRVIAIMPGSPAAKAGLQVGDEIRAVDDERIRTAEGLTEEIGEQQPGATVELSIRRNGERRTLHARLASSQEVNRWRNNRQYGSNRQYRSNGQYAANAENEHDNRGNYQNSWSRNRASSYDPDSQSASQAINQQLRQLRQQIAQLQQEVDELRNQSANGARVGSRNRSNNTSRDGQSDQDQD